MLKRSFRILWNEFGGRAIRGLVAVLLPTLILAGCESSRFKESTPTRELQEYISKSFAARTVSDRKGMLEHLTGDARSRLERWSSKGFKEAFLDRDRKFHHLSIRRQKRISDTEMSVIYELTYFTKAQDFEAKVTNRKMAMMVKKDKRWLIKEVKSIKELMEYKSGLTLP